MADARIYDLQIDTTTGDLTFVDGDLVLESAVLPAVAQAIRADLSTWLGEWYLDESVGVDWLKILGAKPTAATVRAIVSAAITGAPGVAELLSLEVAAVEARRLAVTFSARSLTGDEVRASVTVP